MPTTTTVRIPITSVPAFTSARDLCLGCVGNPEYVRGCAETLIDSHRGLCMDDKEALMEWLVDADSDVRLSIEPRPVDGFRPSFDHITDPFRPVKALHLTVGNDESGAVLDVESARLLLPVLAEWVATGRISR